MPATRTSILAVTALAALAPGLATGLPTAGAAGSRTVKNAKLTVKPSGQKARLRLVVRGTVGTLQLAVRRSDGNYRTLDKQRLPRAFKEGSSDVTLKMFNDGEAYSRNGGQGLVGWDGPSGSGNYAQYFSWSLQTKRIELFS